MYVFSVVGSKLSEACPVISEPRRGIVFREASFGDRLSNANFPAQLLH